MERHPRGVAQAPFALADLLARLEPALGGEWEACVVASARPGIPHAAAFAWGMLEVRLAPGPFEVDVLGCVLRPGAGAGVQVPALAAALATLGPTLAAQVPQAWLEWDASGDPARPLVWWGVDAATGQLPPRLPEEDRRFLHALLAAGGGCDPELLLVASAVLDAARGHGRVLGVGWLRPRGVARARVFVEVGRGALRAFLADIGWPGDLARVASWWEKAIPPWEPGFVQLELGPGVRPYLGLEPRQTRPGFGNRIHHERWLAALVAAGLADPARCAALLEWSAPLAAEGVPGGILRSFHTKLVTDGPSPLVAKAYLGFTRGPAA